MRPLTALLFTAVFGAQPALAATPTFAGSYVHEAQGDYSSALSALADVDAPAADPVVVAMRRGWLHYLNGDTDLAIADYRVAIEANPTAIEPRLGLTLPLMVSLDWQSVVDQCDVVLASNPGEASARTRRAWALFNLGRFADAESGYRALVSDYPSDVDLRAGLGWSMCRQGRVIGARVAFAHALVISPDHQSSLSGLESCGG